MAKARDKMLGVLRGSGANESVPAETCKSIMEDGVVILVHDEGPKVDDGNM